LNTTEGYFTSGYGTGGDQPDKVIELVPGSLEDALLVLSKRSKTRERVERVANLVDGFESPHGLELLATVHWIATRESPVSESDLVERFYAWDERKRRFSRTQILLAARVLKENGWIKALPVQ
jgi:hypothetical protein